MSYFIENWFVSLLVEAVISIKHWLTIYIVVQFCFTSFSLLNNFIKIWFGRRIKPEGSKAILITGATSGFGLALAKHFYQGGFTVFACYYNERETGYKELSKISTSSLNDDKVGAERARLFLIKMDVRYEESIFKSHEEIESYLRKYDLKLYSLINNAGLASNGCFEWISTETISNVLNTNLKGAMLVTRQFILHIIKNKGKVINVASCTYLYPGRSLSVYGTTKGALAYYSQFLHEDLKSYGSSCICVLPGNFTPISNILYSAIQSSQTSEQKLTQEEKIYYRESIRWYNKIHHKLLKRKFELSDENPKLVAEQYGFSLPDLNKSEETSLYEKVVDYFCSLLTFLDGRSKSLDSPNLMEVFMNAVCLLDPPRRLYAGNILYNYVLGPSIDLTAPASRSGMSGLISRIIQLP